ncbi:MAG: bifunctional metallophosphatase/5'-nucleotidase [Thermoanaerobaculaceae bacterium]|nr:bifunctional metallophosphatase/5'-nucleotidase [Thermoanaerobaculaceae bacterium]
MDRRSFTRRALFVLVLAVSVALAAHLSAVAPSRHLMLLYTNDLHAQLDPIEATWLPAKPRVGGMEALSGLIARLRDGRQDVLLVDAGDLVTGPAVSTFTRGAAPFDLLDAMGYDAMAIGNHEFDNSVPRLQEMIWNTSVPVLAANIYWRGTDHRFARPYVVIRRAGLRIAVIGVIGSDAAVVTLPAQVADLEFCDPAKEIRPLVETLRPEVDLVIVLAHEGKTGPMQVDAESRPEVQRDFDTDIRLAAAVPGIDVLVGGHAHRGIDPPYKERTNGTIIVQTFGHATTLGVLDLTLNPEGRGVASYEGRLERVLVEREQPMPEVARRAAYWRGVVAAIASQPVCQATARITRDYARPSALGNLVTDLMRESTQADVALYNAGGLRADLPAGAVTRGDVTSVLPFNNRLVVLRLKGDAIRAALEQGLSEEHGMLQQSGMVVRFDPRAPSGRRVVSVTVKGRPLDDHATYTVATIDFLADGGDSYVSLTGGERVSTSRETIGTEMTDWLRGRGRVSPVSDDRTLPVPD